MSCIFYFLTFCSNGKLVVISGNSLKIFRNILRLGTKMYVPICDKRNVGFNVFAIKFVFRNTNSEHAPVCNSDIQFYICFFFLSIEFQFQISRVCIFELCKRVCRLLLFFYVDSPIFVIIIFINSTCARNYCYTCNKESSFKILKQSIK